MYWISTYKQIAELNKKQRIVKYIVRAEKVVEHEGNGNAIFMSNPFRQSWELSRNQAYPEQCTFKIS